MNAESHVLPSRVHLLARKAKRAIRRKNLDSLGASLDGANRSTGHEPIRVLGPYWNRAKWRVVLVDGKERKSVCAPTHDEALLAMRVSALTPAKAQRLYEELTQTVRPRTGRVLAVATQQYFLSCAKGWGKWARKERLTHVNPFAEVVAVGKKHHGKPQLRIEEATRLADSLQPLADAGDIDALAILLMLHLGLRQGEVGARIARDVDAHGTLLWITAGKTDNAERRLKVPGSLRAPLSSLARRRQPDQLLFSNDEKRPSRQHFWAKLRGYCQRARVPLVCPHALRGLHATLALEAGATPEMVARALGHGSFQVTARHYATPDSVAGSRAARVAEALGTPSEDAISRLLAGLSAAEIEELKRRLS